MKSKKNISVDLSRPSFYSENDSTLHVYKRRLTYKHYFRLLKKYFKKNQKIKILDIGSGPGFFLKFAGENFNNSKLFGIEYDNRLVEISKTRAKYADIKEGNAEKFSFDCKFEIIASFQVIEHLYNPQKMIQNVKKHLTNNGIFLFTTPNLGGNGAKILNKKWSGYRDDHVALKSKKEWEKILYDNGFIPLYSGSTFFSGIPLLNKFPLGIVNWSLLFLFGSLKWNYGEAYVGLYKLK